MTATQAQLEQEVQRRRTFAIISHPDAGKTTLTEKLLLYGGAVHLAGAVKARRAQQHAVSDWMELEKQRGISITSTVLSFDYQGIRVNLLDTPGHQDFSEDTYRTLLAADSAVMILDAARGIQAQTLKLFDVCKQRKMPLFTFINKMDRPALDPLDLIGEVESVLGIKTVAMNWPLGNGVTFKGVYDLHEHQLHWFERGEDRRGRADVTRLSPTDPAIKEQCDSETYRNFIDGVELLEAAEEFDPQMFALGQQTPVYFGSAANNFGVQLFLDQFLSMAPLPGLRKTDAQPVTPQEERFSGFVFKIQADMNPKHRDHVAFLRICSGRFERGMKVKNTRTNDTLRLSNPMQLFAQSRETVDEAFPGDVVGLVNAGDLALGDTLYDSGQAFRFEPIPQFPAEHFIRVTVEDPSRRKQFRKALDQLTLEGAVQVFWMEDSTTYDPILGAVGQLQFEVVEHRLKQDYGVDVRLEPMPLKFVRWLGNEVTNLQISRSTRPAVDNWERKVLLFPGQWDMDYAHEKNPGIILNALSTLGR
ncbi:peptide chain release factor 3 [bacterium]|nr:peptide chain release factor 3 [bacterium]